MIIPNGISNPDYLLDWANSLFIDFPDDNIPILSSTKDWKAWGGQLIQAPSFAENNAPGTSYQKDFDTYAQRLFFVMSNQA